MDKKDINQASKDIVLYTHIGQAIVVFNNLIVKLCMLKMKNENLPAVRRNLFMLYDQYSKGTQQFVSLCKETKIIDETSAKNLYTTRNDIIHSFTKAGAFANIPYVTSSGIKETSLIRVTYEKPRIPDDATKEKIRKRFANTSISPETLNNWFESNVPFQNTPFLEITLDMLLEFNDYCRLHSNRCIEAINNKKAYPTPTHASSEQTK